MNHLSLHASDDEGTVDSATPSIIKSIRDRPIDFDVASSQLICSGFMSKKARGRRMVGKLFDNTRMRWFELRCDGSVLPTYCLLYYKAKDDKKPKGESGGASAEERSDDGLDWVARTTECTNNKY